MQSPAVLLAFDLLSDGGADLVHQPLCDRRDRLEVLLGPGRPYLQLVAQTASVEEAEEWLAFVPGLEGVVAKRADGQYVPGQRQLGWLTDWPRLTARCTLHVSSSPGRGTSVSGRLPVAKRATQAGCSCTALMPTTRGPSGPRVSLGESRSDPNRVSELVLVRTRHWNAAMPASAIRARMDAYASSTAVTPRPHLRAGDSAGRRKYSC